MRELFTWLSPSCNSTNYRSQRPQPARHRSLVAGSEPLEGRLLLAGDVVDYANEPPQAEWANVSTVVDTPLQVDIMGLTGDALDDPETAIDPSTVTIQRDPLHGTVAIDPLTGIVTYTPESGFVGIDEFLYTVSDADDALSNHGRISIMVDAALRPYKNPMNRFDVNGDDIVSSLDLVEIIQDVNENGNRLLDLPPSDDPPPYLDVSGDGIVNPLDMVQLIRELNRIAGDGSNAAPFVVAAQDDIVVDEDAGEIQISLADIFDDADLAAGDALSYSIVAFSGPSVLDIGSPDIDGNLIMTTAPNQWGVTEITVRATDSSGAFAEDTFDVSVESLSDPPYVVHEILDQLIAVSGATVVVDLSPVFDDIEIVSEGDSLVYQVVNVSDPTVVSTSVAGSDLLLQGLQAGSADVTVRATDSQGDWVETTFTVTATTAVILDVTDFNQVSEEGTASVSVMLDNGIGVQGINLDFFYDTTLFDLTNDDIELGSLIADVVDWQLVVNVDDTLGIARVAIFAPTELDVNHGELLRINFTESDNGLMPETNSLVEMTGPATLGGLNFRYSGGSILAGESNVVVISGPQAVADTAATVEATPVMIDTLQNDVAGVAPIDAQSLTIVTMAEHGVLAVDSITGIVEYTPEDGFSGVDSFRYQVRDTDGQLSNISVVSINVSAENNAPVVVAGTGDAVARTDEAATEINLLDSFDDADGDLLTYSLLGNSDPAIATVEMVGDSTLSITGLTQGTSQITVRATDPTGALAFWAFHVVVDPSTTFSLPDEAVIVGAESVTVPIEVNDATGLQGFNLVVTYDTSLFDLSSSDIQLGSVLDDAGGWSLISNIDNDAGIARLALFSVSPVESGSGSVASLTFQLQSGIEWTSSTMTLSGPAAVGGLQFLYIDGKLELVPGEVIDGEGESLSSSAIDQVFAELV